jgi:membrane peptidoglycan carboxypeptidase
MALAVKRPAKEMSTLEPWSPPMAAGCWLLGGARARARARLLLQQASKQGKEEEEEETEARREESEVRERKAARRGGKEEDHNTRLGFELVLYCVNEI